MWPPRFCELEGGTAAMLDLFRPGGQLLRVVQHLLLRGPHRLLVLHLRRHLQSDLRHHGENGHRVSPSSPRTAPTEELEAAFRPNTKAVFGETIANPALTVLDIEKFAKAAHTHGVPLIVDNTFATPVNCRPFEWGADIVTHSTTKYMDGHGAAVGGAIVDCGKLRLGGPRGQVPRPLHRRTTATTASPTPEQFGREGAFITKCHRPADAGLRRHPVPPERLLSEPGAGDPSCAHGRATVRTARRWRSSCRHIRDVAWVSYRGLPGDKYRCLGRKVPAPRLLRCGVLRAEGRPGGSAAPLWSMLKLAAIETHVADARTCCLHPRQLHPPADD